MEKIRRIAYFAILGGFVTAAALHVLMDAASHALILSGIPPPSALEAGFFPVLRDFDDPVRRIVELVTPEPHFKSIDYSEPEIRTAYWRWHGGTLIAAVIIAFGVRRWRAVRGNLALLPPASFRGFPFGIACIGLGLMGLGWAGGWRLTFPMEPLNAGAMVAFVAFVMTELPLRRSRPVPDASADAPVPHAAAPKADEAGRPRRRPVWTVLAIAMPFAIAAGGFALASGLKTDTYAPVAVLLIAVALALVLGAVATIVAIVRHERWVALQVLAFVINFGIGVPLVARFFSHGG